MSEVRGRTTFISGACKERGGSVMGIVCNKKGKWEANAIVGTESLTVKLSPYMDYIDFYTKSSFQNVRLTKTQAKSLAKWLAKVCEVQR